MRNSGGDFTKKRGMLAGASLLVLAFSGQAFAQAAEPAAPAATAPAASNEVVVTGTRIVSRLGVKSPTPITAVSTEQLLKSTPTNIPDGLNKLPVFSGSTTPRRAGSGSGAIAQNVLNLRSYGAQRTLVLFDGQRVAPTNSDGTVDVDTLPQMLMSRVDVVTGGASAVYGSDAVTGVVNFILDKKYTGFKIDANAGLSTYGDGGSLKLGLAGGWKLFDGRGHLLVSAGHRSTDPVLNYDRPYGPYSYYLTGNGTAATPFVATVNARSSNNAPGGLIISCLTACPGAVGQQFISNGVLAPFVTGTPSKTANVASSGDGSDNPYATALVGTKNEEFFSRFSYDLNDTTNFYVQGSYATASAKGWHFPVKVGSPNNTFFKNNPFLPAAVQTVLGNNGTNTLTTNTFTLNSYITNTGKNGLIGSKLDNKHISLSTGLDGTWGEYTWNVFLSHGDNQETITTLNNTNTQKMFAAQDAVAGPNGTVVCYATTQAATAAAYAGCIPLNPFGPTAISPEAFAYFNDTTSYLVANVMDDVGASFAGTAFNNWAGPVDFAVSAEGRWNRYKVVGSANSTTFADCTGLRICTANSLLYPQATVSNVTAHNNVWEVAGELSVPLLKDLPLIDSLDASLAARHTEYSTSGGVDTWKAGLSYKINSSLRIRATESRDIRAPTLADLFQPVTAGTSVNYTDVHTGVTKPVQVNSQGNKDLVPEVARTSTVGIIFTPSALPDFTASLDYYKITMNNAIGSVGANNITIANLCEASNGASPYCALYVRPLPFSDHTAANFPTVILNQSLNIALAEIKGYDLEINYRHKAFGGTWTARLLGNYQPTNQSQASAITPLTNVTGPKTRLTGYLSFDRDAWTVSVQDRFTSNYSQVQFVGQVWAQPTVPSYNTVDLNIERKFSINGADTTAYLNAQNLFNTQPPLVPQTGGIGVIYPTYVGYSIMGAYFTAGIRIRM